MLRRYMLLELCMNLLKHLINIRHFTGINYICKKADAFYQFTEWIYKFCYSDV
jgi:hypothetical protein